MTAYVYWDEADGLIELTELAQHTAEYEVPDDQWAAYKALLNMAAEVEDRLRAQYSTLPDDLKQLRGVLSDEEIQAIVRLRKGPAAGTVQYEIAPMEGVTFVEVPDGAPVEVVPPPEPVVLTQEVRNCPNHRGKIHVPSKYGLLGDTPQTGKVMAFCNCGYQFQRLIRCPHQKQTLQGDRSGPVICSWCGSTIIAGTGATGLDEAMAKKQTSLPAPNPDQFVGNA